MRLLGIDPGLRVTGFGAINFEGTQLKYLTSGCIRTEGGDLSNRIKTIFDGVTTGLSEGEYDHVAIEKVFLNKKFFTF